MNGERPRRRVSSSRDGGQGALHIQSKLSPSCVFDLTLPSAGIALGQSVNHSLLLRFQFSNLARSLARSRVASTAGVFRTAPVFQINILLFSAEEIGKRPEVGIHEVQILWCCTLVDCTFSTSFSSDFLFLLPTFVHVHLYFLLLTLGVTVSYCCI